MKHERLTDALARLEAGTPPPADAGIFGASPDPNECALVLMPVPWDATVSYGDGTSRGPEAIVKASHQLDLEDGAFDRPYRAGIAMLEASAEIATLNARSRECALRVIAAPDAEHPEELREVNAASKRVNAIVHASARDHLQRGKLVGVVGGDHSSPQGLIQALAERDQPFGILHVDAHMDLRHAYEGFEHSHASIMYNVTSTIPEVSCLVQAGIRDYSREERLYAATLGARCHVHYARDLFRSKARGDSWSTVVARILEPLPQDVYVSFDIDGLDPTYCPSTGTPVPGGLSYDEAIFLIEELARSGRRIIGFDLCEVAPSADGDEWDANVGARLLYKLCGATLASQGLSKIL